MSQIRAAFDIGSSHHKLTVARVTTASASSTSRASVQILHSSSIRVGLADALCADGSLSPSILHASRCAIRKLQAVARSYGTCSDAMCGIATAVFRAASNGGMYLSSLDMPVSILCARDEGALAYDTAALCMGGGLHQHGNMKIKGNNNDLIVWDSGGGSTQLTTMTPEEEGEGQVPCVMALPFGSSAARVAFRETGGSKEGVKKMVRHAVERYMHMNKKKHDVRTVRRKLKKRGTKIAGIGSETSMFAMAAQLSGEETYGLRDVEESIKVFEQKVKEQEIDEEMFTKNVPKLLVLAQMMETLGIETVQWVPANGSCVGLLISEDERWWGARVPMAIPGGGGMKGLGHQTQQSAVEESVLVEGA